MLHQIKYVKEIFKRFKIDDLNSASSPVEPNMKLEKNGEEDKVGVTLFKQIVGSLRYMCNNIPDIGFTHEGCKKNPEILKRIDKL